MKTAISVPDEVFEGAERLAGMTGRSRSELYSTAMAEYLASHDPSTVTQAIDRVVTELDDGDATFAAEAARRTLADTEW